MRLSGGLLGEPKIANEQGTTTGRMKAGSVLGILAHFQNPDPSAREGMASSENPWRAAHPCEPQTLSGTGRQQHFCIPRPQSGGLEQHYRSEFQAGISCLPTVMKLNLYTQATGGPCMSHENVTLLQMRETELPHSPFILKKFPFILLNLPILEIKIQVHSLHRCTYVSSLLQFSEY